MEARYEGLLRTFTQYSTYAYVFSNEAIGSKGHIWQMSGLNILTCFVSTHLVCFDFSLRKY